MEEARRRLKQRLLQLAPTDAEIDNLIDFTFEFFIIVYTDTFGDSIVNFSPMNVLVRDIPGGFYLTFEADLSFIPPPPTIDDVIAAAEAADFTFYVDGFVRSAGDYFALTQGVALSK